MFARGEVVPSLVAGLLGPTVAGIMHVKIGIEVNNCNIKLN